MKNLNFSIPRRVVLIGASTGGPGQIQKIIDSLPILSDTSVVIAQHMVDGFIDSFTKKLQLHSDNSIKLIRDKQIFEKSNIYIAQGETTLNKKNSSFEFSYKPATKESFNPDINLLFNSFLPLSNKIDILSVILTGIGDDGVESCKLLSEHGARCVTESEQSAIVDGMPNRARSSVKNIEVHDIKEVINIISEFSQ
ncbi:chemotaxis protein CheB [Sulfurimonas sp.]